MSAIRTDEGDFVRWLFAQAGLASNAYRPQTLSRRVPACLRLLRAATCAQAREILQLDPARINDAIGAMVIGVTSFFRDAAVFDHLTYSVLREMRLLQRGARIWSAGCSDGAELYSVAMLLTEMNLLAGAHLLGTDCRPQAIARAREGRYAALLLRDVPPPWVEKYFARSAGDWQIRPELRRAVQWRRGDVTQTIEPSGWDVILCRNMAMYLRPDVAGQVWEQIEQALRPGGFLVLGKAERPVSAKRLSPISPCIYRRDRG